MSGCLAVWLSGRCLWDLEAEAWRRLGGFENRFWLNYGGTCRQSGIFKGRPYIGYAASRSMAVWQNRPIFNSAPGVGSATFAEWDYPNMVYIFFFEKRVISTNALD